MTGSTSRTIILNADGQELYSCRCGQDHTKETLYEYGWHNCFHEEPLLFSADTMTAMCALCGCQWELEGEIATT